MPATESKSKGKSTTSRKKREADGQLSFWEATASTSPPETHPGPSRAKRRVGTASTSFKVLDPEVSGLVGNEILEGRLQPAAWAMALANSSGSRDEAVSHYARLRLESLSSENQFRKRKLAALESRRSSGFKKLIPEPSAPSRLNQKRERLNLPPFWLAAMWLSVTGACSSAVRLFLSDSNRFIAHAGISPHVALGAALVCLAVVVHVAIPRARMLVRTVLPFGTCALAFASFSFGVMILKYSAFEDHQPSNATAASTAPASRIRKGADDKKLTLDAEHPATNTLVTAP